MTSVLPLATPLMKPGTSSFMGTISIGGSLKEKRTGLYFHFCVALPALHFLEGPHSRTVKEVSLDAFPNRRLIPGEVGQAPANNLISKQVFEI